MGQTLSGWRRNSDEDGLEQSSTASDSDSRHSVDTIDANDEESLHGEVTGEYIEEQEPLESLADEFMKKQAFLAVAEAYGIEDDYLSGDVPMEVCYCLPFVMCGVL